MANKASSGKVEFWTAAIELFQESTLSGREFCKREGLSYSTFCRWQERLTNKNEADEDVVSWLNSKDLPKKSDSGELTDHGKPGSSPKEVKFVSAGLIVPGGEEKAGIEIRFSFGVSIDLCQKFDRVAFKDVVSILGAELC